MSKESDSSLLFGVLALQMDFISREQLVAATTAWVQDKTSTLADNLLEQRAIDRTVYELVCALVSKHLELHDNRPERSLSAVGIDKSVRHELESIADPDVEATISQLVDAESEDEDLGSTLGHAVPTSETSRFRVLQLHDRGGLGEVYVALDQELNRKVALKEINKRHENDKESRARFSREAEITGGLEHPGIVPVYGYGHYADGRPYYAMRFIRGENLSHAIRMFHKSEANLSAAERSVTFRQLLGRFIDVCHAVEYAHSRGVLHRDLKPRNVMLGKYGETLVVDWGLAKAIGDGSSLHEAPDETVLTPGFSHHDDVETAAGRIFGTLQYMSPEQARGHVSQLGPASDVYSLGATLYTLLTGKAPFSKGDGPVLEAVIQGDFPPPRQLKPSVPRDLENICLKAMARAAEQRYASPQFLAADIECWLADESVSAGREPWTDRARRWARRHRTLVSAAVVLLMTATVALGIGGMMIRAERDVARQNALTTRETLDTVLVEVCDNHWSQIPRFELKRIEMLRIAVSKYRELLKQYPDDPQLQSNMAEAIRRLADRYKMVSQLRQAKIYYDESEGIMRHLVQDYPASEQYQMRLVHLLYDKADYVRLVDGPTAAEHAFEEAYELGSQFWRGSSDSAGAQLALARMRAGYADALRECGRYERALEESETAAEVLEQFADRMPSEPVYRLLATITWTIHGRTAREAGKIEAAARGFGKAEAGISTLLKSSETANARQLQAWTLYQIGCLRQLENEAEDEVQELLDEAISILETHVQDFPHTSTFARELAEVLTSRGNLYLAGGSVSNASDDAARSLALLEHLDQASDGAAIYQPLLSSAFLLQAKTELEQGDGVTARNLLGKARERLDRARTANRDNPILARQANVMDTLLAEIDP